MNFRRVLSLTLSLFLAFQGVVLPLADANQDHLAPASSRMASDLTKELQQKLTGPDKSRVAAEDAGARMAKVSRGDELLTTRQFIGTLRDAFAGLLPVSETGRLITANQGPSLTVTRRTASKLIITTALLCGAGGACNIINFPDTTVVTPANVDPNLVLKLRQLGKLVASVDPATGQVTNQNPATGGFFSQSDLSFALTHQALADEIANAYSVSQIFDTLNAIATSRDELELGETAPLGEVQVGPLGQVTIPRLRDEALQAFFVLLNLGYFPHQELADASSKLTFINDGHSLLTANQQILAFELYLLGQEWMFLPDEEGNRTTVPTTQAVVLMDYVLQGVQEGVIVSHDILEALKWIYFENQNPAGGFQASLENIARAINLITGFNREIQAIATDISQALLNVPRLDLGPSSLPITDAPVPAVLASRVDYLGQFDAVNIRSDIFWVAYSPDRRQAINALIGELQTGVLSWEDVIRALQEQYFSPEDRAADHAVQALFVMINGRVFDSLGPAEQQLPSGIPYPPIPKLHPTLANSIVVNELNLLRQPLQILKGIDDGTINPLNVDEPLLRSHAAALIGDIEHKVGQQLVTADLVALHLNVFFGGTDLENVLVAFGVPRETAAPLIHLNRSQQLLQLRQILPDYLNRMAMTPSDENKNFKISPVHPTDHMAAVAETPARPLIQQVISSLLDRQAGGARNPIQRDFSPPSAARNNNEVQALLASQSVPPGFNASTANDSPAPVVLPIKTPLDELIFQSVQLFGQYVANSKSQVTIVVDDDSVNQLGPIRQITELLAKKGIETRITTVDKLSLPSPEESKNLVIFDATQSKTLSNRASHYLVISLDTFNPAVYMPLAILGALLVQARAQAESKSPSYEQSFDTFAQYSSRVVVKDSLFNSEDFRKAVDQGDFTSIARRILSIIPSLTRYNAAEIIQIYRGILSQTTSL